MSIARTIAAPPADRTVAILRLENADTVGNSRAMLLAGAKLSRLQFTTPTRFATLTKCGMQWRRAEARVGV